MSGRTDIDRAQPVFLCDVDGVVCDLHTPWYAKHNRRHNDTLSVETTDRWPVHELAKGGHAIYEWLKGGALYDEALPLFGAVDGIAALRSVGFRVVFVSSTGRDQADAKRTWLERHDFLLGERGEAPHADLLFVHDKSLVRGHYLLDDYEKNLEGRAATGLLFTRPWNAKAVGSFQRVNGWASVVALAPDLYRLAMAPLPDAAPETCLEEAQRLVYGARGKDYGHPLDDYIRTAAMVTPLVAHKLKDGEVITAEDMVRAMICVKLSRDVHSPKRDNRVDAAGYAECLQRITDERAVRAKAVRHGD